jgi:hypothetical protein
LRPGEYFLTPLQAFLINKKLARGVKLELEENYIKANETFKHAAKKLKTSVSSGYNDLAKGLLAQGHR